MYRVASERTNTVRSQHIPHSSRVSNTHLKATEEEGGGGWWGGSVSPSGKTVRFLRFGSPPSVSYTHLTLPTMAVV